MRKSIFMALVVTGLTLAAINVNAQEDHHYVSKHPYATVGKRPARPSPKHVWVGSEWGWKENKYVETPGHWDMPPAGHKTWVAGRWSTTRRGQYWVAGHWS